jgi:hypothetical protein
LSAVVSTLSEVELLVGFGAKVGFALPGRPETLNVTLPE